MGIALHLTLLIALASMSAAAQQTGSISGRVTEDVTGAPVAGATVSSHLMRSKNETTARTDEDGRYTLQGLRPGGYVLRAEHPSYVNAIRARALNDIRIPIVVAAGQAVERIDFPLAPAAFITGVVTGAGGRPVEKARVTGELIGERMSFTGATSNERGEFELRLASGRYLVHASALSVPDASGRGYELTYFPGVTTQAGAAAIAVSAGDRLNDINIPLMPQPKLYAISGRVAGSGDVRVSLVTSPAGKIARNAAGPDGVFKFDRLKPGRYIVSARAGSPGLVEVASETVDLADDVVDLALALHQGGRISGRIVTEDMTPPPDGIRVIAALMDGDHDVDPTSPDQVEVDADGSFTIDGLFGTRRLRVISLLAPWSVKTILINRREASPPDVVVKAGATVDAVEIVIARR